MLGEVHKLLDLYPTISSTTAAPEVLFSPEEVANVPPVSNDRAEQRMVQ